jgi:hypothetical protein|tara:strand:- start:88 stop:576 length:489 start_codon:yes stop_codon:yes gene_type:complete
MKAEQKFIQLKVIEQKKYSDIEKEMGVNRAQLTKWWHELKDVREPLSIIRKIWKKKCNKIDFWEFHEWYIKPERKCHYCGINEEQIKYLIEEGRIVTTRLSTRGRTLEIERLEPKKPYDEINNLVYSCYWCNNAKTDEFTEEEFKLIGKQIEYIWKARLNEQ